MGFKIFRAWHMSKEETIEYSQSPFTFFILYNNELYVGIFSVSVVLNYLITVIEETMPQKSCLATREQYIAMRNEAAAELLTTQAVDNWDELQFEVVAFYYDDIIYRIDRMNCN